MSKNSSRGLKLDCSQQTLISPKYVTRWSWLQEFNSLHYDHRRMGVSRAWQSVTKL